METVSLAQKGYHSVGRFPHLHLLTAPRTWHPEQPAVHHQSMAKSRLDLTIEGTTCDGCVRSIERKLSKVAGVESARVHLGTGKATVEYDDSRAQIDQLIAAVEQIGYHTSRT
jgi:copper chaperone